MTAPMLAIIAIGQTPRRDLWQTFTDNCPSVEVALYGALDDVDDETIEEWADPHGDYPLSALLRNGHRLELPRTRFVAPIQAAIDTAVADGAQAVVVLCTGDFPELQASVPLLLPGRIVPAAVATFSPARVAVITPAEGQIEQARGKWRRAGIAADVVALTPSIDADDRRRRILDLSQHLVARGAELLVLDCFGFDAADARSASRAGRPVISAQDLTARVAGSFVPPASFAAFLGSPDLARPLRPERIVRS